MDRISILGILFESDKRTKLLASRKVFKYDQLDMAVNYAKELALNNNLKYINTSLQEDVYLD